MSDHLCHWWYAYSFDNALRKLIHDPRALLGRYIREGMTVVDVGCGMGHFSIGMARLVGETGSVIAADLQQKMLDVLEKRAIKAGVEDRIRLHQCNKDGIGLDARADFALAFYMVHEVPDAGRLFQDLHGILTPKGKLLVAEPKMHVSRSRFADCLESARHAGFHLLDEPRIRFSQTALFERNRQGSET